MSLRKIEVPEWEELKKHALEWEQGDVIPHRKLASIMYLDIGSQRYYNMMRKATKELTNVGIRLMNVKGEGYKVLTPNEWVEEAKKKIYKGGKNIAEAQEIINHAPYTEMSEEVRSECLKLHDLIIKQKFLLSGGIINVQLKEQNQIQIREGSRV